MMRVGIAADHGGFALKQELLVQLRAAGHEAVDFGAHHLITFLEKQKDSAKSEINEVSS